MIKLEGVSKIYPEDFAALSGIDLVICKGEFVSIVGQSGAGKSTLLKLIYAEEQPTAGRVYFNDRPLDSIRQKLLPFYRRNIGTVFQDFKLLPHKTIFENIAYALEVDGDSDAEIFEKVGRIMEIFGISDKADKYPKQLSSGQQQKVSLARAMVHRPKVIIADEPTGNLDPISTWEIIQLLLKINSMGTTVLLATHDKGIVDKIRRRVVVMEKGKIVSDIAQGKYAC
jgi:cell division transport system ATP-binding protein